MFLFSVRAMLVLYHACSVVIIEINVFIRHRVQKGGHEKFGLGVISIGAVSRCMLALYVRFLFYVLHSSWVLYSSFLNGRVEKVGRCCHFIRNVQTAIMEKCFK